LIGALITYCELCSVVTGAPLAGIAVSAPWALRVSVGWILVGTVFAAFGRRIADSRLASDHPAATILGSTFGIAILALSFETLYVAIQYGIRDFPGFLSERTPVNIAISSLLIAIYVAERSRKQRHGSQSTGSCDSVGEVMDVMTGTGHATISIDQIECLEAEGNYINVVHSSGREYLLRRTMAAVERGLDPDRFVRIHRSTIINRHMIKERRAGGVLVLRSGRTVKISRTCRDRLR
jgi:LytTr DNA-binding domain